VICICLPLLPIKIVYKYLYVKTFFDKRYAEIKMENLIAGKRERPPILDDLLSKYPDDPDLLALELCIEYSNLNAEPPKENCYSELENLLSRIQKILDKHPQHEHAQDLLRDIINLRRNAFAERCTDEEWIEFADFIHRNFCQLVRT
jgi:hypothetical protein